jgi:hypothetical protein
MFGASGPWPSPARYTDKHFAGVVQGWELGNEPEGWLRNFNATVANSDLASDFRRLRAALPNGTSTSVWGPDYGIQGCITKNYPCKDFSELVADLGETVGPLNFSTYHHYNLGTGDTAVEFVDPAILDRSRAAVEAAVGANAAAAHPRPVWLGEGATASGGGIAGSSGTYSVGAPLPQLSHLVMQRLTPFLNDCANT